MGSNPLFKPGESNPFVLLETVVHQTGQTAVTWELDSTFTDPGPYEFYLEVSLNEAAREDDDYTRVNSEPAVDKMGIVLDETIRRYSFDNKAVYRVVLETPRGTYTSDPEKPNGNVTKQAFNIYKEILRKESLRLSPKFGASQGTLFKRRTYGEKCAGAIDKNTGQVVDYNNKECFGTEFLGGYFPGIDYPLLYLTPENYTSEISQMGTQERHAIKARSLVYPMPTSKDVWYEHGTGRAFYIDSVVVTSKFNSKPISLTIEMNLASPTDIIYDFIDVKQEIGELAN
tara:strand:- start:505 stop:1362 length:858 start_codon:yes stop_codon:yes gene_type:complete